MRSRPTIADALASPGARSGGRGRLAASVVLAALLLCCAPADPPEPAPVAPAANAEDPQPLAPRARGLWVLCEGTRRVLEDVARVEALVADAQALGASDLFVQVYRGGRAWYDAERADAAPYREILAKNGIDTFARLIELAHARGMRVHAWVNVLSLSHNRKAPILGELGRDAILVDRRGRSVLDYPDLEVPAPDRDWYRMGTRGVYLDPGAPGVRAHLVAAFEELVLRYPALDGLHLDYIRHPGVLPFIPGSRFGVGLDFGYGAATRLQFQRDTGLEAPSGDRMVNSARWDDWRREQVTALVREIRATTSAAHPDLLLSAAVISYLDRAYLSLAQDWPLWLDEGQLDFAVPMAYTLDDRLLRYQVERFGGSPHAARIWVGLGTWLFAKRPEAALRQIEIARKAGASGDVLFSYDSIVEADTPEARSPLFRALSAPAVSGAAPDES